MLITNCIILSLVARPVTSALWKQWCQDWEFKTSLAAQYILSQTNKWACKNWRYRSENLTRKVFVCLWVLFCFIFEIGFHHAIIVDLQFIDICEFYSVLRLKACTSSTIIVSVHDICVWACVEVRGQLCEWVLSTRLYMGPKDGLRLPYRYLLPSGLNTEYEIITWLCMVIHLCSPST